jgi:hypothetical protein
VIGSEAMLLTAMDTSALLPLYYHELGASNEV